MTSILVEVNKRTVEGSEEAGLDVTEAPVSSTVVGDEVPKIVTRTVEVGPDLETVIETTETATLTGGHTVQYRKLAGTQVYEEPLFR